ncbi:MAG: SIMPL domain-containing protein [Actinomycetia bacterium]|nr:SIMPL domain-containing protein [Actinomycetes bacterium]
MRNRTWLVLALALVVGALALGGCTTKIVTAPSGAAINTVTATGEGKAVAAPDQADMNFGITTQGTDAKKTLDDAARKADAIIAALKKAGVAKEDLQTSGVNVYPQQDYSSGKTPRITGYQASVQVRATIKDMAKIGDVINAGTGAGANEVSGPAFTLSDQAASRTDAIDKAIADAKSRAEVMAKAAGKSVGDVLGISETGVSVPPIMYGAVKTAADAAGSVPIETGTLDVTANVTVVFELK